MQTFAQSASAQSANLSHLESEFSRVDATFVERLTVMEIVRDAELTGIGEFYHNALRTLLQRLPDIGTGIGTGPERYAANNAARIIVQGLGAEQHAAAASDLWQTVLVFDVAHAHNDGLVMQDALTALGQVDARNYITHIVERLNGLNTYHLIDLETRRRVQRAVVGCINALETFGDRRGFRPVFFASMGAYEQAIRSRASIALPNIAEDPSDIISEIIRDPSVSPPVKYEAWRELLRTRTPNESRARTAAVALDTGWTYMTNNPAHQRDLRAMRISAIDTIRALGMPDGPAADWVYINLERSYRNNFVNVMPDYEEIRRALACLSAIGSERAVDLLLDFLRELHLRRRVGPWSVRERQVMSWVIPSIGASRTQNQEAILLLTTIQRSLDYTAVEQGWARDALRALGQ
jgi:HEAT repeat protein